MRCSYEPFEIPCPTSLIVTMLPAASENESDSEEAWLRAVASNDSFEFLADPVEDIYTLEDGEPFGDAV